MSLLNANGALDMAVMRWVGRGVLVLAGLTAVAIGGVYAQSERVIARKGTPPSRKALVVSRDSATLALGEKLTVTNGCQDCHTASLGGKVMVDDPAFARVIASNLTSGEGGVLARYDDRALDAAIRDGVGWDGRKLWIMPSAEYSSLADADVAAIIANIRGRAPVANVLPERLARPVARVLIATGKLPLAYDLIDHSRQTRAVAPVGGTIEQGQYIAAGCVGCHGANYAGAEVHGAPPGTPLSPNLTPTGRLSTWTQAQFVVAIRTGVRPDGTTMSDLMPWKAFAKLSDDELNGLYAYLRTLPAAPSPTK